MIVMKNLKMLCVVLGLLLTTAVGAQTVPLDLQLECFYSDAPGYESGQRTHLFGGRMEDTYNLAADFYLESLSVEDATLYVYWYDEQGINQIYDWVNSGPIEADCDFSTLEAGITLPPGTTGVIHVEFTIYFVDGSQLDDFRYVVIE
jgi:hypothetical protein